MLRSTSAIVTGRLALPAQPDQRSMNATASLPAQIYAHRFPYFNSPVCLLERISVQRRSKFPLARTNASHRFSYTDSLSGGVSHSRYHHSIHILEITAHRPAMRHQELVTELRFCRD